MSWGDWHIPFGEDVPEDSPQALEDLLKVAVARAARTSYTSVGDEGKAFRLEDDIALHDALTKNGHWSPTEHIAQAAEEGNGGNFGKGWSQHRKTYPGENQKADLWNLMENAPSWVRSYLYESESNNWCVGAMGAPKKR